MTEPNEPTDQELETIAHIALKTSGESSYVLATTRRALWRSGFAVGKMAGAAAEREACAKLFDDEAAHARALKESCKRAPNNSLHGEMLGWYEREMVAVNAADAIRARKG